MNPREIFRTVRGVEVVIKGSSFSYDPSVGIDGHFEEIWAETLDGDEFALTPDEEEKFNIELSDAEFRDSF